VLETLEEVDVAHRRQKIAAAAADVESRGPVKVSEDVAIDLTVSVNLGTNLAARAPVKTFTNRTSVDSKLAPLKHSAAAPTFPVVHQSTRTVPADSRHLGELNSEVKTDIGRLSGRLSTQELHQIHNRVFWRR